MNNYQVVIVEDLLQFPPVFEYWQRQIAHNLLKFRLPEIKNPTMEDVRVMIADPGNCCMVVWSFEERMVAGEAMLNTFNGLTAAMHFSVDPEYRKSRQMEMCREALKQIFELKLIRGEDTLRTVIGVTPTSNKLSINFLINVGFNAKCVINDFFVLANYGDRVVDGALFQLSKEELRGWVDKNRVHTTARSRDIT